MSLYLEHSLIDRNMMLSYVYYCHLKHQQGKAYGSNRSQKKHCQGNPVYFSELINYSMKYQYQFDLVQFLTERMWQKFLITELFRICLQTMELNKLLQ